MTNPQYEVSNHLAEDVLAIAPHSQRCVLAVDDKAVVEHRRQASVFMTYNTELGAREAASRVMQSGLPEVKVVTRGG